MLDAIEKRSILSFYIELMYDKHKCWYIKRETHRCIYLSQTGSMNREIPCVEILKTGYRKRLCEATTKTICVVIMHRVAAIMKLINFLSPEYFIHIVRIEMIGVLGHNSALYWAADNLG